MNCILLSAFVGRHINPSLYLLILLKVDFYLLIRRKLFGNEVLIGDPLRSQILCHWLVS